MIFGEGAGNLESIGHVLRRMADLQLRGQGADDVARVLREAGVKGLTENPSACPVHEYLVAGWNNAYGDVAEIATGKASISINFNGGARLVLDCPAPISAFITAFDKHMYPDLEVPEPIDIDGAVSGYIECLFWTETDGDEQLDANHEESELTDEARTAMATDVRNFIEGCQSDRPTVFNGMDAGQIGHDFALTRNGHGTGFWDRGLGERGTWLSAQAKPYREARLEVWGDGHVHYCG